MRLKDIAKLCHEVNRAYCQAIGDPVQPPWEEAPDWQQTSCIHGVQFHLENPDAGPKAGHETWLKEKQEAGWKYGLKKDEEKKEHPCMVPFERLPEKQKVKDYLFWAVVQTAKTIPH